MGKQHHARCDIQKSETIGIYLNVKQKNNLFGNTRERNICDRTEIKKRVESMEMVVNCEFVRQPLKKFERMSMVKIVQNQIRSSMNSKSN